MQLRPPPAPVVMPPGVEIPPSAYVENALDFTPFARTLAHIAACSPLGALPERF